MELTSALFLVVGLALGIAGAWTLGRGKSENGQQTTAQKVQQLMHEAKQEAHAIREAASEQKESLKQSVVEENERREDYLKRWEESVEQKKKHVDGRLSRNGQIKKEAQTLEEEVSTIKAEQVTGRQGMMQLLFDKTKTTEEDILNESKARLSHSVLDRKERFVQHRVAEVEEDSVKLAKIILSNSLQRYADESSVDRSITEVVVRQEKFKPSLIGDHAVLIQHFEEQIDVEVIFNDYPKTITIGGYNLLKRQVAREAIDLLQNFQGTITTAIIDNAIKKAEKNVNDAMIKSAKRACQKIGLKDVPEGLLQYIGRLHFRTSYGQNALKHCLEVGFFAGLIAAEIGADVEVARIAGFFHDVGKAISEESDKGHDFLTKDILEEFKYPEEIIHAAWVHHEAEPAKTLEAKIVMAADALSASRPGARLESLERYLRRIRELEGAAKSFPGVKKTFAISAGREVRVIVNPSEISDEAMKELAHSIAQKIEDELTYPGNVKVNLIRRREWEATAQGVGGPQAPLPRGKSRGKRN